MLKAALSNGGEMKSKHLSAQTKLNIVPALAAVLFVQHSKRCSFSSSQQAHQSVLFNPEHFSKDKPANRKLFPFSFEWCTEDAAKLHSSPFQKGVLAQKYIEIQIFL